MANTTRYELTATAPDGRRFLAGYVRIPSVDGAMRMLRQHGADWARITGATDVQVEGTAKTGRTLRLGAWAITYSRRTKLEAEKSPLPWFKTCDA